MCCLAKKDVENTETPSAGALLFVTFNKRLFNKHLCMTQLTTKCVASPICFISSPYDTRKKITLKWKCTSNWRRKWHYSLCIHVLARYYIFPFVICVCLFLCNCCIFFLYSEYDLYSKINKYCTTDVAPLWRQMTARCHYHPSFVNSDVNR